VTEVQDPAFGLVETHTGGLGNEESMKKLSEWPWLQPEHCCSLQIRGILPTRKYAAAMAA